MWRRVKVAVRGRIYPVFGVNTGSCTSNSRSGKVGMLNKDDDDDDTLSIIVPHQLSC